MTGALDFSMNAFVQHCSNTCHCHYVPHGMCPIPNRSSPPLHVPPRSLERAQRVRMDDDELAALEKLGLGPNVPGPQGPACHRVDIVSTCQCCIRCVRLIHDLLCPRPEAAKSTRRRSGQRCQKLQPQLQLGPRLQPRWLGPRLQPRWLGPRLQPRWLGPRLQSK